MMSELLLLQPVFKDRIWGGTLLKKEFKYNIPTNTTGECWAISAHPEGESIITNGKLKGMTLSKVYQNHPELFNNCKSKTFPLLTKIIDAAADLSVQVHPDDDYASKYTKDHGKTECWYVVDAIKGATMIFGHKAQTKEEFISLIEQGKWDELLIRRDVKKGDFIYVPAGTIHALCKGTMVLETQQSSDTTYRLYDYDRVDALGNKRQLHIKESIDVTTIPHNDFCLMTKTTHIGKNINTKFVSNQFFTVEKWDIQDYIQFPNTSFYLISVIEGEGLINLTKVTKGMHLIITSAAKEVKLEGKFSAIVSYL